MQYIAEAKYVRVSTRKMRLIADAIRPLPVMVALQQLARMPKAGALPLKKVIDSCVANAHIKNGKGTEVLTFRQIMVGGGPAMKRWHAVSKGTAHAYKKRMTHITVVLSDDMQSSEEKGNHGGKKMIA